MNNLSLDEIIEDEYSTAIIQRAPHNYVFGKLLDDFEISDEDQGRWLDVVADIERYCFEQGFMRGLAAARSGLV